MEDNKQFINNPSGMQLIFMKDDGLLHIDESYIEDLFGKEEMENQSWSGLTEDYNDLDGPFDAIGPVTIDLEAYLKDMHRYQGQSCHEDVLKAMIDFLEDAKIKHQEVKVMENSEERV